jgi:hypothetical protein
MDDIIKKLDALYIKEEEAKAEGVSPSEDVRIAYGSKIR